MMERKFVLLIVKRTKYSRPPRSPRADYTYIYKLGLPQFQVVFFFFFGSRLKKRAGLPQFNLKKRDTATRGADDIFQSRCNTESLPDRPVPIPWNSESALRPRKGESTENRFGKGCFMRKVLTKYLLLWLTLTCVLSFYWDRIPGISSLVDPFDLSGSAMKMMISVAMLVIGSLLPLDEVKMVIKRWPLIIGGTFVQFTSMPILALLAAKIFRIEDPYYTGLILTGVVPGAMASNLLTMLAGGNTSYSVGLTTSSTLFSPFVIPLLLYLLLGKGISPAVTPMMLDLLLTVVTPVVVGFTLSRINKFWNRCARAIGEIVGNIVIIWIISAVVAANRNTFGPNMFFLVPPVDLSEPGGVRSRGARRAGDRARPSHATRSLT